jgi:hypothetical protein
MSLSARVLVARASAVTRRTARERRKELERELAGYSSESDLRDFEALLDSCPDGATREVRGILADQAAARGKHGWSAVSGGRRRLPGPPWPGRRAT